MEFEHPEAPDSPVREQYLTEEDILNSWSAEKLARYYYLQSIAATFGGMVHPDGPYHKARERYLKLELNEAQVNGANTIIKTNVPTVHPATVDGEFFEMQEQQRNAQAEFNGMRHEIELALEKDKIDAKIIEIDDDDNYIYVLDQKAILDYTRLYEMATQLNADGLFYNYFLHINDLFAISPLFNTYCIVTAGTL